MKRPFFTFPIYTFLLFLFALISAHAPVNAQSYCCDLNCYNGLSNLLPCGPYEEAAGPFYVKIYLRFVDGGTGSFEDSFDDRANTIWSNLRTAYAPHNIFFVPGFDGCEGSGSYQVISSSVVPDVNNLSTFNTLMMGSTNSIPHYISGGINLYIFGDNTSPTDKGQSFCIPNDYCYVGGKDNCCSEPMSATHLVSHEIGHCLGLLHTFHDDNCLDIDGTDCFNKGDLVCDTPHDDGNYGTSCTNAVLDMNIMSYFPIVTCRNQFVDGQGKRMRYYLQNNLGTVNQVRMQDVFITAYTTWNTSTDVPANVIIKPGGVLNITAPVTMRENAFIYIEANHETGDSTPGGELRVDEVITAACPDKFWQGVIVDGSKFLAPNSSKQGRLLMMNDGVIEHARVGVRAQGQDLETGQLQSFATGGIVRSSLGTFRDNLVDASFAAYTGKNTSFFNFTHFSTDDDYRGGTTAPKHVVLDGVQNVRLMNCHFEDYRGEYSDPETRGIGIEASDANFSVSGASEFTNLFEGIHISNIDPLSGYSVTGATFEACFTGIFSNDDSHFVFKGNTFNLQRHEKYLGDPGAEFIGIHMEGSTTAFEVSDNHFAGTGNDDIYVGTDVISITKENNPINDNTYEYLNVGNRASGLNAEENGMLFSGLSYECNEYNSDIDHDHFVKSGAIRKEQGGRNLNGDAISSGNVYNDIIGQQFTNEGLHIEYHHILFTSQELMDGSYSDQTITPVGSQENTKCGTGGESGCPNYPCSGTFISTLKSEFFQEKEIWSEKKTEFPAITDEKDQESEAMAINSLRRSLDRIGDTILLHHALDTNGVQIDSMLLWLGHLDSYDADMALTRYYFFQRDFSASEDISKNIAEQYDLGGAALTEFEDIMAVLESVRPSLESEISVDTLPGAVLDTLEVHWGTTCSAAGALARNLLYRNGRHLYADCNTSEARPSASRSDKVTRSSGSGIKIFPNPADQTLTLERNYAHTESLLRLTHVGTGRVVLERIIQPQESNLSLDISALPPGVYAALVVENSAIVIQCKLVIAH